MDAKQTVIVVDDDSPVRDSLRALLESAGYGVKDYSSAKAFLDEPVPVRSCLIVDIRMPGMDGLELLEEISKRAINLPVVIITGHGDVPLAVRAMKAGAMDFVEKPFNDEVILESVKRALVVGHEERSRLAEAKAAQEIVALLTPRERNVLEQLVAGRSNKLAA